MSFFRFNQNNSGGKFKSDDVLCEDMFIEADTPEEANRLFLDWGGYFDGVQAGIDCGCCGDRWYAVSGPEIFPMEYDGKGTVFNGPEEYFHYLAGDGWAYFGKKYRIFYKDGRTVEFKEKARAA